MRRLWRDAKAVALLRSLARNHASIDGNNGSPLRAVMGLLFLTIR
jgi:hypothetical protein